MKIARPLAAAVRLVSATQSAGVGMALAVAAMFGAAFGLFNATQSAILQEVIDASAILWALTPLALKLKKEKH